MALDKLINRYSGNDEKQINFLQEIKCREKKFRETLRDIGKYDCSCSRKSITKEEVKKFKYNKYHIIWSILHDLSFLYLDSPDKEVVNIMISLLKDELLTIRCPVCRKHYVSYIKDVNFNEICSCKLNLIKWLIDLHNDINKKLDKPILSYEEVFKRYNLDYKDYSIKENNIKLEEEK